MSLRFLLGILGPGSPDQEDTSGSLIYSKQDGNIAPETEIITLPQIDAIQNQAKLHIGMLTISLLIGLAYGGFTAYNCWKEKSEFLSYIRNLVIALVCRTFFSIIFDGAILLGSFSDVGGGNTLMAFEQMCINLVLAFWLTLTIYLHAWIQKDFKSEPTLNVYKYGIPAVALFFAFIWIFVLQDQCPSLVWWFVLQPLTQWIVNSFNLLCLLIQLGLVVDILRKMMMSSLDNDSVSLFRKIVIMLGVLVFVFWLQLGLFIGRVPMKNSSGYAYFFYFVDGVECAVVCVILYFLSDWVQTLLNRVPSVLVEGSSSNSGKSSNEELLAGRGGRGIVTIDSVFMTNESGKWKNSEEEGVRDVVYSNVVEPQRLNNILNLYKRLNRVPSKQVTVVEGEEFFDCQFQEQRKSSKQSRRSVSDEYKQRVSSEESFKVKKETARDQTQKKTAFYSSKYLIVDSKGDIPKYLETRPSLSSRSGRGSWKEDRLSSSDYPSDVNSIEADELVRKWLSDNSENMQVKQRRTKENALDRRNSESKMQKHKSIFETAVNKQDTIRQADNRVSFPKIIVSKFNSDLWGASSGTDKEKNFVASVKEEANKQDLRSETFVRDPKKDGETDVTDSKETKRNQSLNSIIQGLMDTMLASKGKEETPKDETTLTKESMSSTEDLGSKTPTQDPPKDRETEMDENKEMTKTQSLNSILKAAVNVMLPSTGKEETSKDETTLTKESMSPESNLSSQISEQISVPVKGKEPETEDNQQTLLTADPALTEKDNETYKFEQVTAPSSQDIHFESEVCPTEENEKIRQEIPLSGEKVDGEKEILTKQKDDWVHEAKEGHLNVYLTYPELQKYRQQRENRPGEEKTQAPQSFFDPIKSFFGWLSSEGGRTDLPKDENLRRNDLKDLVSSDPLEIRRDTSEMKIEKEFEEQSGGLEVVEQIERQSGPLEVVEPIERQSGPLEVVEPIERQSGPLEVVEPIEGQSGRLDVVEQIERQSGRLDVVEQIERQSGRLDDMEQIERQSGRLEVVEPIERQSQKKEVEKYPEFEERAGKPLKKAVSRSAKKEKKKGTDFEEQMSKPVESLILETKPEEISKPLRLTVHRKKTKKESGFQEQVSKQTDIQGELKSKSEKREMKADFKQEMSKPADAVIPLEMKSGMKETEEMNKTPEIVVPPPVPSRTKGTKTKAEFGETRKPGNVSVPLELKSKNKEMKKETTKPPETEISPKLQSEKKETVLNTETNKSSITSLILPATAVNAETPTGRLRSVTGSSSSDSEFSIEKSMKGLHLSEPFISPPSVFKSSHLDSPDADKTSLESESSRGHNKPSPSPSSGSDFSLDAYYQSVLSARNKTLQM